MYNLTMQAYFYNIFLPPDKIKAILFALYEYSKHIINVKRLPMPHFTSEELKPSEKTLNLIKQIAYTYRTFVSNSGVQSYCLN